MLRIQKSNIFGIKLEFLQEQRPNHTSYLMNLLAQSEEWSSLFLYTKLFTLNQRMMLT